MDGVHGASIVGFTRDAPRQMINFRYPFDGARHITGIRDRTFNGFDARCFQPRRNGSCQHAEILRARINQLAHQMSAEKTRPARD